MIAQHRSFMPRVCVCFLCSLIELYQEHALLLEQQLASALHSGHILAARFEQLGQSPTAGPALPIAGLSGGVKGSLNDPYAEFTLDSALALQVKEQLKDRLKRQLREQLLKDLTAGEQSESRGQLHAEQQQLQQLAQQQVQQQMQQQRLSLQHQRAAKSGREMEQREAVGR